MNVSIVEPKLMDLNEIRSLIKDDMRAVDQVIQQRLSSDVALINQLSHYIINSGGKRLRPMLAVLAAQACEYAGEQHLNIAAIIEFIHTATLLHDDVVDASELRRGHETANAIWGNEASVLVGDFLYSRAFQMMVDVNSMRVMDIMASTTNTIAEGEVMQLLNCNDPDTTEERYFNVIHCKTAKLFQAAAQLGAVLAGQPQSVETAMAEYGLHLGVAFQLVDDILDYCGSSEEIGKNLGDDLAEGKPTLPLIYAMKHGSAEQQQLIRTAIEHSQRDHIESVIQAVESTGAINYTAEIAKAETHHAISALDNLSESVYKDALIGLAEFSISRTF